MPVEGKFGYSVGPEMLLTFLQSGVWVRFWWAYESQRTIHKAQELCGVDFLGFPCRVSGVVESVGIFQNLVKLLHRLLIDDLVWSAEFQAALPDERTKQLSGWEVAWTSNS